MEEELALMTVLRFREGPADDEAVSQGLASGSGAGEYRRDCAPLRETTSAEVAEAVAAGWTDDAASRPPV